MQPPQPAQPILLKLGGSLITDKTRPNTPRPDVLERLAAEIAAAVRARPALRLVLGHGSGSFGHIAARKHRTHQGVRDTAGWQGFVEVWRAAASLHRLVMDALHRAGLPAVSFPPSAVATTERGRIVAWDTAPLRAALEAGLLPVVYGDVTFDTVQGGAIVSTETVFDFLARELRPQRILIAGIEPGVWADYPACTRIVPEITPANLDALRGALHGAAATDVTGGMAGKVDAMLALVAAIPGLEVCIFAGTRPGAVQRALLGEPSGTRLHANRV